MRQPALAGLAAAFALALALAVLGRTDSGGSATAGATTGAAPTTAGAWQLDDLARPDAPGASAPESQLPPPRRLRIDSLDLDERLIDLGIARDGTMQVPRDPGRVGWFAGGGRPGGPGPTVVVGHVDSVDGPAVFARLSELRAGDLVTVSTGTGAGAAARDYVVTDARDVPQDDFPTAAVFGASRSDVLRLITCTGPYDREVGRYTQNRVVSAVPA